MWCGCSFSSGLNFDRLGGDQAGGSGSVRGVFLVGWQRRTVSPEIGRGNGLANQLIPRIQKLDSFTSEFSSPVLIVHQAEHELPCVGDFLGCPTQAATLIDHGDIEIDAGPVSARCFCRQHMLHAEIGFLKHRFGRRVGQCAAATGMFRDYRGFRRTGFAGEPVRAWHQ